MIVGVILGLLAVALILAERRTGTGGEDSVWSDDLERRCSIERPNFVPK